MIINDKRLKKNICSLILIKTNFNFFLITEQNFNFNQILIKIIKSLKNYN